MSDLRTRLIRLAHSNPELRPHVLPLVAERTAAKGYNAEEAAWLFNWLTKKVVQAVRPYKLPVKAEVVSHGDRGFEGVIRIGDDPPDRQPFDRNSSMHLTVNPVKVGSGRPDLVRYNVELLDGNGKSFEVQTDYELDEFKRQSARAIMENLAIILSSNDKVEREWLAEQAMGRTAAWENLPEGWTEESVQSFWDNLTGDVKHKITKCMKQMEGKVTDTGAFCGSLASQVGYRAASAGTLDATTVRRAAIRVAHEDASTREVILPLVAERTAGEGEQLTKDQVKITDMMRRGVDLWNESVRGKDTFYLTKEPAVKGVNVRAPVAYDLMNKGIIEPDTSSGSAFSEHYHGQGTYTYRRYRLRVTV